MCKVIDRVGLGGIIENLWPESAADWLLLAGDVGERMSDVEWALRVPGNHELWTHPGDEV